MKVSTKEVAACCHLITGRNVKDLSLENVLPQIVYCMTISESCHLIWFMPRLHLLRSSYDLVVYDFSYDFSTS